MARVRFPRILLSALLVLTVVLTVQPVPHAVAAGLRVCESTSTPGRPLCDGGASERVWASEWPKTGRKCPVGAPSGPFGGVVLPLLLTWLDCFTNSEGVKQSLRLSAQGETRVATDQDVIASQS